MADADTPEQSSAHEQRTPRASFSDELGALQEMQLELEAEQLEIVERHISRQTVIHGIGELIVEFQLLETGIRDAISYLVDAGNRDIGLMATTPLKFREMLAVFRALFYSRIQDGDERAKLRELLRACLVCAERRNAIVHSYWYQDSDGKNIRLKLSFSSKGEGYGKQSETVLEEVLNADANECVRCAGELIKLMTRNFPY